MKFLCLRDKTQNFAFTRESLELHRTKVSRTVSLRRSLEFYALTRESAKALNPGYFRAELALKI